MTPERHLTSVLLPAPFSPTIACSSPGTTSSDTSLSATTPENRLVTWQKEMTGGRGMASAVGGVQFTLTWDVNGYDRVSPPIVKITYCDFRNWRVYICQTERNSRTFSDLMIASPPFT